MCLGSGAEWRLLVGGEKQVLAAVRPTSQCSAMERGGGLGGWEGHHPQADLVACKCSCRQSYKFMKSKRFLESVSDSVSIEMLILSKWLEMFGNQCM